MMKITLFVDKRHVKDILRSLSHELVHHAQNCRGEFNKGHDLGEGSFSTNKELQRLELEAYAKGNGDIVRRFEDLQKESRKEVSEMKLEENKKEIINEKFEWPFRSRWWDNLIGKLMKWMRKRSEQLKKASDEEKEAEVQRTLNEIEIKYRIELNLPGKPNTQSYRYEKTFQEKPKVYSEPIKPERRGREPESKYEKVVPESIDHFVESILNELNYLPKQDILKENNDMSVKEEGKGPHPGLTCAEAHKGTPCPSEDVVEEGAPTCPDGKEPELGDDGHPTGRCVKRRQMDAPMGENIEEEVNENWRFANKDQLLFEELVKKWTK